MPPAACCSLCGRLLSVANEPLSNDCGGDCWGCISEVEAERFGLEPEVYRRDHDLIWAAAAEETPGWVPAKPWWKFWA